MAASGFFTYHDLYGGKPEIYHHLRSSRLSSSTTTAEPSSTSDDTTITSLPTTINFIELISPTTIQSSTSASKLYKFVQLVPFAYFHWFLIGLAILLTLLLTIIFTCYCRGHCRKNKKSSDDKKQPLPNLYRYRTVNRRVHPYNMAESTAPLPYPSPTRPCPQKSVERLNNKLLRQGLDAVASPQIPRTDVSRTGPSCSFSSTASDLLTEMKSRFSMHSSEPSLRIEGTYETQRANMALNDDSLLIHMH